MYQIKLGNGKTLKNLELNGNNFISDTVLDDSIFEGGLDTVQISDGTNTETHTNMELIANRVYDGKSWFILRDIPAAELREMQLRADVDFIAAMQGVSL